MAWGVGLVDGMTVSIDGEQVTVESCESACASGCDQLHGLGRTPGRWDDSVY